MKRRAWSIAAAVLALTLTACGGAPLPASVVPDSSATVAWSHGGLTTLNAALSTGVTGGDLDVAQLTRAQFARERQGEVTTDPAFGEATISDDSGDGLTVRYDLAEPVWSDGIALDAADLLLAWAAGSGALAGEGGPGFASAANGLRQSTTTPTFDEFGRWVEVEFDAPVVDWQTAIDVAVPAHVVGRIALGLDDPMVAKKAVIDAITQRDADALTRIALAWNEGFAVGDGSSPAAELSLSSGPFRIEEVTGAAGAGDQRVQLVANGEYAGEPFPAYERIVLQQASDLDPTTQLGTEFDVMQVRPDAADFDAVQELERDDYGRAVSNRGQMWALVARVDGSPSRSMLADPDARRAFLAAVPAGEVVAEAAGPWSTDYAPTSSMVFPPGTDGYDIAVEDAGRAEALSVDGNADDARRAAEVPRGARVCVLYDTGVPFAGRAFEALRDLVGESGWSATDCGSDDPLGVVENGGAFDAALVRLPVPIEPRDLRAQWGSDSPLNISGATSGKRDALIDELERTTDAYDARDTRVEIEKTIVDQLVSVPLAMDPVITLSDRDVEGVQPSSGTPDGLVAGATGWAPVVPTAP
ncbi:ABC transporter substrate-binding protein [Microbacterium halophytorum]|uniref:ABC transporter substrate-binding protein n=1 Tax=Microbacterium halophytorum TaxID=2067568 RepID=UPI000CFD14AB|nr:ABC transporter substrate-binding protein [Microbacterium halophytorum]